MSLDTMSKNCTSWSSYELVVDTFLKRWSLHVRVSQLILTIATTRGKHELNHMQTSILDVLQHVYPGKHTNHLSYNKLRKAQLILTYLMAILTLRP